MKEFLLKKKSMLSLFLFCMVSVTSGQQREIFGKTTDLQLFLKTEEAWQISWDLFFDKHTNLFYDFISSYDPETSLAVLPTPKETAWHVPNRTGWGTGMEDCAISGGVMMSMICDRFTVLKEASMYNYAEKLFAGMVLLGTLSQSEGFVIRGVTPIDGKSHYPESSIDQYTWYVYGLWRYYHSPLSDDAKKETVRNIITTICKRLERNVVAANDYHIGTEYGKFDGLVDKMWNIKAHGVGRLPMIYAIGADVTDDEHWCNLAKQYIQEAAAQAGEESTKLAYAMLQHQISLETLLQLERNRKFKSQLEKAMNLTANRTQAFLAKCREYEPMDVEKVDSDWRKTLYVKNTLEVSYIVPRRTEVYINEISSVREPAEAALIQLLSPSFPFTPDQIDLVKQNIAQVDYSKSSTSCVYYTQAVYWRAVRQGLFQLPKL